MDIQSEQDYIAAVEKLDGLMNSLYGFKKQKFNNSEDKKFYLDSLMEKIERLQDAITDYEVSLMQLKEA